MLRNPGLSLSSRGQTNSSLHHRAMLSAMLNQHLRNQMVVILVPLFPCCRTGLQESRLATGLCNRHTSVPARELVLRPESPPPPVHEVEDRPAKQHSRKTAKAESHVDLAKGSPIVQTIASGLLSYDARPEAQQKSSRPKAAPAACKHPAF
jgi:hypothetical protein